MSAKNAPKYFPRGSKKKADAGDGFIFNAKEKLNKSNRDKPKFLTGKNKRAKTTEFDEPAENTKFKGTAAQDTYEFEDVATSSSNISGFKPEKGSLVMMAVSQVHRNKYVICNHTLTKKGFMATENGIITGKQVGDYMYGVVIDTKVRNSDKSYNQNSKKLQLTDNLNIFNTFLSAQKLQKGMQLQGLVESKEDKGYMINLCLKDGTKAFLNYKNYKGRELKEGEEVSVILKGTINKSQKIIKCVHQSAIDDLEEWAIDYNTELNYECAKPGFLVKAKIEKIVDNGVRVTFGQGVSGVIFVDHLQNDISKYKKKKYITARVISVDFEKKRIGLSELPHLVNLTPTQNTYQKGEVFTNGKILKRIYGNCCLIEAENPETKNTVRCFLYQKPLSKGVEFTEDPEDRKRSKGDKQKVFQENEKLKFDLVVNEFNYLDGVPIVATMDDTITGWHSLKGGLTVEGTISEVVDDEYLVVDINDTIFGRIYKHHLTDVPQKHIPKKYKHSVGKKMNFKIWYANDGPKILELTKKETLLKDKVFIPTTFDDPRVTNKTKITGMVSAQTEKGLIIEYYNNLRGFLPFESLEKYNKKYSFEKGQLIDAYLLFKAKKGLYLTVSEEESANYKESGAQDAAEGTKRRKQLRAKDFKVGAKMSALVAKFDLDWSYPLIVKFGDKSTQFGSVFFRDLGLKHEGDFEGLEQRFEVGNSVDVYIKSVKVNKKIVNGNTKKETKIQCSLVPPNEEKSTENIVKGSKVLVRFVKSKPGFGYTVQYGPEKYGFVDICELSDEIGVEKKQICFGRIIDAMRDKPMISTRDSLVDDQKYKILGPEGTSLEFKKMFGEAQKNGDIRNMIVKYNNWRELLTPNMLVRGYVTSVNQHGVFMKLASNLSVRAANNEVSDKPNESADTFLSKNTVALGRILSFRKDKINISLRESIVKYGIEEVQLDDIQPEYKAKLLVLSVASKVAFCQIIGSKYKCKVKLTKDDPEVKVNQKIIARIKSVNKDNPPKIMMHEVEECNEDLSDELKHVTALLEKVKLVQELDYEKAEEEEEKEKEDEIHIKGDVVSFFINQLFLGCAQNER